MVSNNCFAFLVLFFELQESTDKIKEKLEIGKAHTEGT